MAASAAKSKSASLYDVHPGVAMVQKWIAELKPKTGHSLEEWIALLKKTVPRTINRVARGSNPNTDLWHQLRLVDR